MVDTQSNLAIALEPDLLVVNGLTQCRPIPWSSHSPDRHLTLGSQLTYPLSTTHGLWIGPGLWILLVITPLPWSRHLAHASEPTRCFTSPLATLTLPPSPQRVSLCTIYPSPPAWEVTSTFFWLFQFMVTRPGVGWIRSAWLHGHTIHW